MKGNKGKMSTTTQETTLASTLAKLEEILGKVLGNNSIDENLESMTGPIRIGDYYYMRTVTFHHIGRVKKIGRVMNVPYIQLDQAWCVMQAGDSDDATSLILKGKADPKQWEDCGEVTIWVHSLTDNF